MKIGSLFTGYGGLDMALAGELAWYSEIDAAACRVLEAHHRDIPNLRDVTSIDWADVSCVDVLTAGYPCQPFSHAGKRQGSNDERHLWPYVAEAIDAIRPGIVVLENVRGHLTLGFGDVLADLSRLGYDARWGVVRASDAGAPHHRARIFIVAYSHKTGLQRSQSGDRKTSTSRYAYVESGISLSIANADCFGCSRTGPSRERKDGLEDDRRSTAADADNVGSAGIGRMSELGRRFDSRDDMPRVQWRKYEPAIRRWEYLTRPAPAPTIPGNNGRLRLSPIFVEWMMGLPEGWVTGHGLSSSQCLKMLGNGVVPQQAALALRLLTRSL